MAFLQNFSPKKLLNSDLERVVDDYLDFYASNSSHTARAKLQDLRDFINFLREHKKLSEKDIVKTAYWDYSSVQVFVENLINKGLAPSSVARKLATLKHLGRTLAEQVVGFVNPTRQIKAPKSNVQAPTSISPEERQIIVNKLLNQIDQKNTFQEVRNSCLIIFMLETGVRAEECRLLRFNQLSDDLSWAKGIRTKGRKFRNVYLSSRLQPLLKIYLEKRQQHLSQKHPSISAAQLKNLPLFISSFKSSTHKPDSFLLSPKSLWRIVNNASLDLHLHPHILRHTFAVNLLDSSKDIRLVSQALGHSDVRITMRYTHRPDEDIAKAIEKI